MTYRFDSYNYIVRLKKGELLIESLTALVQAQDIKAAWVNGLGGALWAELGFYDLPAKNYKWQRFDELLEITSLQGNVSWKDNRPALHVHGTVSGCDFKTVGGHVKELAVAGTCEVFLHTIFVDKPLMRTTDSETGLALLDL